ncbi:hypothetical protein A1O3_00122 [Capronia epimyces CBS 606.96]|uniref:DFDF domain-containing protein n=1 Tax=Capronia epimyces CBS 606.96 TaxID=1182542 RepID=W9ZAM8_9EURO|nr:uncharacterized protein A1O3_00122 [Capronia epimyces CBS 606.96]EXJ91574.1 hypothetical protein A1O3_00122 [Capronia epimyces CBS 606.96]
MDMDHLIGQRFNLISKSEIRYVGTLHEINPEQSTIALENVYSFGTEDRKVEKFVPPSQQKYGFIIFRGSDVKDIKIAEEEQSQPSPPPAMPNDPAILNASRPGPPLDGPPRDGPFSPPGYPPHPGFGGFYPPPGQFGRGYGPPPAGFGPGPGFPPYGPPPPGYFGPPGGQGFPPGPGPGPGPGPFQLPPPPIGPPGQRNIPQHSAPPQQAPEPNVRSSAPSSTLTSELPDNKAAKPAPSVPSAPSKDAQAPVPPQAKPTTAGNADKAAPPTAAAPPSAPAPTGPKVNRVIPAVPFQVNQKSFTPPVQSAAVTSTDGASAAKSSKPVPSQAAMDDAARQAKEAVAAAMAKLNPQATTAQGKSTSSAQAIDALSKRVAEMSTSGTANGTARGGRGGIRGTRGGNYPRGGGGPKKMEIPNSDFDFESANAKFKKEDLVKEAIASGSPPVVGADENGPAELGEDKSTDALERKDNLSASGVGYNKSTSFFDNISSEARDRGEGHDGRAIARQVRSEEFRKNIETFGQANVDSGFRGRGRGGGYGRGRPYGGTYRGGYNRGFGNNGYRGNRGRGGQGQGQGQDAADQPAAQS